MTKCQRIGLDRKIRDCVLPLLESLDTPRSLSVAILMKNEEWLQLVELRADPTQYEDVRDYARAAAATDLLRNYQGLPAVADTHQAAVDAFWETERTCALTNTRLRDLTEGCAVNDEQLPPEAYLVVGFMRTFVREVLGPVPNRLDFFFGPGATVSDGANLATLPDKLTSLPTVTSNAECILPLWEHTAWARAHYRRQHARTSKPIEVVKGNIFFSVVKNAKKKRGAAKGPSLNVSAQLGLGRLLRERLQAIGLDLQTGQDLHQKLAREGSVSDDSVTIDLKSASDTVAKLLIKLQLPEMWFDVLSSLREPFTRVEGKWCFLEKFSAMGNGFTFELETLAFLAIIAAAVRLHDDDVYRLIANNEVSVYGDDIIVPKRYSATVISLLRFFGFETNDEKTFTSGNFRESCGGDYFNGRMVTPFRLKEEISEPHQWISFHNGVIALQQRMRSAGCYVDFEQALGRIRSQLPHVVRRCVGPTWLGDTVLHGFSGWEVNLRERKGLWWLPTWQPFSARLRWDHWYPDVQLASALYGAQSVGVSPRGVTGHRVKRVGRPQFLWSVDRQNGPLYRRLLRVTGAPS